MSENLNELFALMDANDLLQRKLELALQGLNVYACDGTFISDRAAKSYLKEIEEME